MEEYEKTGFENGPANWNLARVSRSRGAKTPARRISLSSMRIRPGLRGEETLPPTMQKVRVPAVSDGGNAIREHAPPSHQVVRRDLLRHRPQGWNFRRAVAQEDQNDL